MEPEPDEVWAYKAPGKDPLTPVRVVRHGSRKPPRILIAFEDDAMEGHTEWVPPGRLKVPWEEVDSYLADLARWQAVRELWPPNGGYEVLAAEDVFELLVPMAVASLSNYCFEIRDAPALARLTGLPVEDLTDHEVSFEFDGALIAPWPVMLAVVKALCQQMPGRVLAEVDKEERKLQDELIHGFSWTRMREDRDVEREVAIVRETDEEGWRQSREVRRQWSGAEAVARWDELTELRKEIQRVGDVAEEAIETLRRRGHTGDAEQLTLTLGEKVEMLRTELD